MSYRIIIGLTTIIFCVFMFVVLNFWPKFVEKYDKNILKENASDSVRIGYQIFKLFFSLVLIVIFLVFYPYLLNTIFEILNISDVFRANYRQIFYFYGVCILGTMFAAFIYQYKKSSGESPKNYLLDMLREIFRRKSE